MSSRLVRLVPPLAATLVAACAPGDQPLPFDVSGTQPVQRQVTDAAATLSTPAGASIAFPAGAMGGAANVTLATAPAAALFGAEPAAPVLAAVTPAGYRLAKPARVELQLADAPAADAWLASFVVVTPDSVHAVGDVSVDLNAHLAAGDLGVLGTVTAVVPAASQRVAIAAATSAVQAPASLATVYAAVHALGASCGWRKTAGAWGWVPCAGLAARVDPSLLAQFDAMEVVYPSQSGTLAIAGDARVGAAAVTGALEASGFFRARLKPSPGQRSPGSVALRASFTLRATPLTRAVQVGDRLTLSNLEYAFYAAGETERETVTLDFPLSADGRTSTATFSRTVDLGDGHRGAVTLAARVDVGY